MICAILQQYITYIFYFEGQVSESDFGWNINCHTATHPSEDATPYKPAA